MNFLKIYDDSKRSKTPKLIKTADNKIWKYSFKNMRYEEIPESEVQCLHSVVEFDVKGKNELINVYDVVRYCNYIKKDICGNCLELKNWNYDFVKIKQLIKYLVNRSIKDEIVVDNNIIMDYIDEASAGGVLIAEKGKYEGVYSMYDINNSYNKFFLDYDIPSNPKFETVKKISKKTFRIYRLFIAEEYRTKEYNVKFKTSRKWFTYFDIKILKMFNIPFELVEQENNCISFESVESDFEWIEKLNELKQNTDKEKQPMKKNILKQLLSSVWGELCKYETQGEFTEDEELPENLKNKSNVYRGEIDRKYYLRTYKQSGEDEFVNPNQRFKFAVGIIKPFVLAYGRQRLLEQIKKLQDENKKVVYAHTDSIIVEGKCKKYFEIGSEVGMWKLEKRTEKDLIVNNIASKILN
jgi:hypothetical protein